ncbi:nitroreductase family protein [Pseudoxanthomonas composti]|uniref:Putative NAD(P)H nitroreductase n=1 Tax=Pseudoxanthomonas composti TaxID=2137479 RepID=A0A4Q1JV93_9GAMM|nr:nitroreductase [Pseudoxanthomonas composti]RXR04394.1 nitroreductase [Pseudoxanthomonas composti]
MPTPTTPDLLRALDERRSVPSKQLGEPAPSDEVLLQMLRSASRVPDHGKLAPFRFIRIQGDARRQLGDILAARTEELDPEAGTVAIEKDRNRFNSAPLVIVVVASLIPEHKVPEDEQWMTAGSVCFALLVAAQAFGFGAQWLTGWAAYDGLVAQRLGLAETERVAGFIHIGTPKLAAPERERPDPARLLSDWTPA